MYIYTYIHAYIHTYIHACMHTYIHIYTYIYTYMHAHTSYTIYSTDPITAFPPASNAFSPTLLWSSPA